MNYLPDFQPLYKSRMPKAHIENQLRFEALEKRIEQCITLLEHLSSRVHIMETRGSDE